ncbi:hypothetical protein CGRA01v4_01378 [Colletotrichum graminicola]|nr:hypothetical protein CGRA01v4_01378 [Colletotrichum graminicola]
MLTFSIIIIIIIVIVIIVIVIIILNLHSPARVEDLTEKIRGGFWTTGSLSHSEAPPPPFRRRSVPR